MEPNVMKAANAFVRSKGAEMLDPGTWFDITYKDEDGVHLVLVSDHELAFNRQKMEEEACKWLKDNIPVLGGDMPVVFDHIKVTVLDNEHAFIKHHVNCLGKDDANL